MLAVARRGDNLRTPLYALPMIRPTLRAVPALAALAFVFAGLAPAASAALAPCRACAGVLVDDPLVLLAAAPGAPALASGAFLAAGYNLTPDSYASPAVARAVEKAGLIPWVRLGFRTAAPLVDHATDLQLEFAAAAELARQAGPQARYEIVWTPVAGDVTAADEAFLLKRAAVAITGAEPEAEIASGPLPADEAFLRAFYAEEVAAYLDLVTLSPPALADLPRFAALVAELDPGRPLAIDALPFPADPRQAPLEVGRWLAAGASLVLFRTPTLTAESLAPLRVLANELVGDLSLDPGSAPGGAEAIAFVRGEDLGLRLLVATPEDRGTATLRFDDPQLREPLGVDLKTGTATPLPAPRREGPGLVLRLAPAGPVALLRLSRPTVAELAGISEQVDVAGERPIPVEEILRRLQASEDAQQRRLLHYQAVNATTLRFQLGSGVQSLEATFQGEYFVRQGQAFDWAWQELYINGVRWKGKKLPEIPLIQPEKAAAMPLEIRLGKEYRYRLRGTETIAGRSTWAVEFEPTTAAAPGRTLYRGTVWVDRETFHRVRSRTLQLGLTGEVLSNDETLDYSPVDANGQPTAWSREAYVLPLAARGQQILSVVNSATVVERETTLSRLQINGPTFDARREEVLASESTMVRDTDKGLRYLVKDGTGGERKVQEKLVTHKLFALGGAFWDGALDFPVPLVGVNYFDLDFRGGKRQLNAFFGGVLGIVNYADPRFLGTRMDLGVDAFVFGYPLGDSIYRNDKEVVAETVRELPARVTLNVGYPLGSYGKLEGTYRLSYSNYRKGEETASDFRIPSDHLEQRLGLELQFARSGYRLRFDGGYHRRSTWEPWGYPGNPEYDPEAKDYLTWEGSLSKNWYFAEFRKLGLEVDYLGGSDLDRFSKYGFGFFGGNRVHGYQIGKVRAEEAWAAHLSGGLEIGKAFRLEAIGDVAWATDAASGLDRELLAGVGLTGSFIGPWETLVNLDLGVPVAGPDDGFTIYIVFLKLFR